MTQDPRYPRVSNAQSRATGEQVTYRMADVSNPNLKQWAKDVMERDIGEILNIGYLSAYLAGSLLIFAGGSAWSRRVSGLTPLASTFQSMGMSCANSGLVGYPILLMAMPAVASTALALNMIVEKMPELAQAFATLEWMNPGRAYLGFGSGESLNETPVGDIWPSPDDQVDRMEEALEIIRALWDGEHVTREGRFFTVKESVSGLFSIHLRFMSPRTDIDFDALIGRDASFQVTRGTGVGEPRFWKGVASNIEQIDVEETVKGLSTYQATIVPRLWLLTQRRNYRMFQQKSEPQIVEKILFQHGIFGHDRFLIQMSVGTLPHADVLRAIELLGTEVAPKVREALQAAKR